jgi:2-isopropylmalate synthase
MNRKPFFYDVTLRDGNQALARPWNTEEKTRVFDQLIRLGVQGIEVIAGLARAVKRDIEKVYEAIQYAAKPRIHTFIATSPFNMANVLKMEPSEVKKRAVEMVSYAKSLVGDRGSVQFSAEHFGDCRENMDFVLEVLDAVVKAGATTLNLPNTVERYRPQIFVDMVKQVVDAMPKDIHVAVHTHNDLGMASATTVESYFAGATQLECALNGLGERAGNTNFYEVAVALYNCGVEVPIHMNEIYETALLVSEWANVPIWEKAPLIGAEAVAHRSGIHQDGAAKTKGMSKGAYRPIDYSLIGRNENDVITFTSQSGRTAVWEMINGCGYNISIEEAAQLQPVLKEISENEGELSEARVLEIFKEQAINRAQKLRFTHIQIQDENSFEFGYKVNGVAKTSIIEAEGPIEACLRLLTKEGFEIKLLDYNQSVVPAQDKDWAGRALSSIRLEKAGVIVHGRGVDNDTLVANMKALFCGANLLYK